MDIVTRDGSSRRVVGLTGAVLTGLIAMPAVSGLQPATGAGGASHDALESYRRARDLVEQAREAMGPVPEMLALAGRGTLHVGTLDQGFTPEDPGTVSFEEWLVVDEREGRVGYESRHRRPDGVEEWVRFAHSGPDEMQVVDLADGFAVRVRSAAFSDTRERLRRMAPVYLLRAAIERAATLRYTGGTASEGRRLERATFTLPSGETITLSFDAGTGRLAGAEYLVDLPLHGDTVVRWAFDDDASGPSADPVPMGYRVWVGDRLLKTIRYSSPAKPGASRVFDVPEGIATPPPPAPPAEVTSVRRARITEELPGVYLARNVRAGFHVVFVEFEEFVVACEAPTGWLELHEMPASNFVAGATSGSVAEELIREIKATVPGKPIRYLMLTHAHGDHAGGVRPFIAEGATILASPTTARAIERAASRAFTLVPDRLSRDPQAPAIEHVTGRRVIADDSQAVEVLPIDGNPHADGLLLLRLPRVNAVYVADLVYPWPDGEEPGAATLPLAAFFVEWLDRQGLDPETVFASHGTGLAGRHHLEELRRIVPPIRP